MPKSSAPIWSALVHARGPAHDVPKILDGLRSTDPEVRARALQDAWNGLWSGKRWYSAQPPFVEELFDLAADPGVEDRHRLLGLAANILTRGTGDKFPRGLGLEDSAIRETYRGAEGAEIHRSFVDHLLLLVALLDDEGGALRAAAVQCLAFVPEAPSAGLEPLLAAIDRERDEAVLATMLHVLGIFVRYADRGELSSVLERHAAAGPLVARACALTGIMSFNPAVYTVHVRDLFVEAMALPDQPADRFPFKAGMLDQMLAECVFASGGAASLRDLHLTAIRAGVANDAALSRVANDLLVCLPRALLTTRDELTDEQLAVVGELSQREIVARFDVRGLPMKRSLRRRWLELDPVGPLNWPVDFSSDDGVQRCSIWKALILAEEEVNARPDLLRASFSALARLEIFADQALLDGEPAFTDTLYQGFNANDHALLVESLDEAGRSALPWALRTTEQVLLRPDAVGRMNNASLVPMARALGQDEALDERYDAAVKPTVPSWGKTTALLGLLREVLARIPPRRRESIFLRAAALPRHGELSLIRTFSLCATSRLAEGILQRIEGGSDPEEDEWRDEDDVRAMLEAMVSAAHTQPELAAALRSYVPRSDLLKAELPRALANLLP